MKKLYFEKPIKIGMQIFLLLAILFLNFSPAGTNAVYAAPLNDDFANANVIDNITYFDNLDTTTATQAATDPDNVGPCDGKQLNVGNNTVWYQYTPGKNQTIALDTIGSTYSPGVDLDTYIAVWTGAEGALTLVACDDDNSVGLTSQLSLTVTAGTTYYIEVASFNGIEGGPTGSQLGGNLVFNAKISNTQVIIANTSRGRYYVPSGASNKVSYASVANGAVSVKGSSDQNLIAGMGVTYVQSGKNVSYSQMLGIPSNQAAAAYYFPRYTTNANQTSQLRVANVGATATDVKIFIGGILKQTITALGAGKAKQANVYNGLDSGPVRVVSTNPAVKIVASMRVTYKSGGKNVSSSELMGLPASQLTTAYLFPNNVNSTTLKSQLRVANVGGASTTVKVYVNGVLKKTITGLGVGKAAQLTVSDAGLMRVESTNSAVNIVASMRQIYYRNGVPESYSELMGYPRNKLAISYVFPWYTNNASMGTKLYIANMGNAATTVDVYIGGIKRTSFSLAKGEKKTVSFGGVVTGLDKGPIRVESTSGVNILVSMQITYKPGGIPTSYTELTGYRYLVGQPTIKYLFPWYTNNTIYKSQLLFGYP